MTSRTADAALVTTAALVAAGVTAYGGHGLIAMNVGEDSGWFQTSVAYVPVLFVVGAVLALGLVSVTDGFVNHSAGAYRFARNTVAAVGTLAAFGAGSVHPSYFLAIGSSAAGAVAILALGMGRRGDGSSVGS